MTEPTNPRAYGWSIQFRDTREGANLDQSSDVAIGNMDGSWYVDWNRLHAMREFEVGNQSPKPNTGSASTLLLLDLLIAARGNGLREVSLERTDEIALEYGAKMEFPGLHFATGVKLDGRTE